MSAANGLRVQTYVRHLLWLSNSYFFFFFVTTTHFFLELLLKLLCMVSNVLPSVSVWVCSTINMESGERMNTWRECTVVPSPFLNCSPLSFFFSSPSQSVCLSLPPSLCPHLHLHYCSLCCRPPTYFCSPPHHNGTVVGQGITEPD